MSFQGYLRAIEAKTGKTAEDFRKLDFPPEPRRTRIP